VVGFFNQDDDDDDDDLYPVNSAVSCIGASSKVVAPITVTA
jgi:hypothetical protein